MFAVIRSFILISIALSSLVSGQSLAEPLSADEKKTGRRAWIVSTSLPDGVKSPVTIFAGGKLFEVRLSKRSVGKAIKVPKDGRIQVVKPVLSEDGEASHEILASVMIAEGVKESLIILVPVPNLKPPLKFKARVVDLSQFRGGNALFVNITKLEIAVVLGPKKTLLGMGHVKVVDIGKFDGTKNAKVAYYYRLPEQKKWNLISASTVPLRASTREILIFSYNSELGVIDYHGISFHVGK